MCTSAPLRGAGTTGGWNTAGRGSAPAPDYISGSFFFSSRRRHTRCGRDWSSDVCSSDLRKKDLFITAGGKNIAPQRVENLLKTSLYIHDAIAIGDGRRYITAMLVLDEENVVDYAQRCRIPFTTYTDLTQNPEIRRLIEEEVRRLNRHLSQPEQVKRFVILPKRLYHEEGEMTPTLKVKRRVIMEKYQHLLAELYPEG